MSSNKLKRGSKYERNKVPLERVNKQIMITTAEEYNRQIAKGKNREALLEKLATEYGRDPRTIERWIRRGRQISENKAGEQQRSQDPTTIRAKMNHIAQMAEIARSLAVSRWEIDENGEEKSLRNDELPQQLDMAWEHAERKYRDQLVGCLNSHLEAELQATGKNREPDTEIEALEIIGNRETLIGKCKICKDW